MFLLTILRHVVLVLLLVENSKSQEIQGRVNLGLDPSSPVPESFLFNLNVGSGTLPLFFDLYNVTNGSSVEGGPFDEDVTVTCNTITAFTAGDSVIQFTNTGTIPLRNGDTTGTVSFDIITQGRRIEVQCSGETAPSPPGTTAYFNPDTSAGRTGFVTIKKDPVASLCSDRILVPNADGITTGQVTLHLSEPVESSNVTGKCEVTGVPPDNPTNWLAFENVRIFIGEDSAVVRYRITGRGGILRVQCSAESDDGVQYQTDLSKTEEALFDFESGSVQILPATSKVTGDMFAPVLALSEPLRTGEADVTFFCRLTPLNTTDEAQDIIDGEPCVAPVDTVPGTTDSPIVITDQIDIVTKTPNTTSVGTATPMPPTPVPTMATLATPIPTTPAITTQLPSTFLPTNEPTPVNDTATWDLARSQIVFQQGDVAQSLEIRLRNARFGFRGGLLVRCCATAELNTSPKYTGLSSSAIATVEVAAARSINWTSATDSQKETTFTNPAYTEVAPCPCDLTANSCDVNCCCDQLCTEDDLTAFTCITGIPGGNFTKQYAYNCSNRDIYRPDWFPFLCVETDNSPHLGLYFTARSGVRNAAAYNNLKATILAGQTPTSFEDEGQRSLDFTRSDAGGGGYKFGFPVETLFNNNARGFLAVPEVDPNGGCSWLSPIQFQVDTSSRCDVDPQQSLCVESSVLNPRAFILSTNTGYPPCREAPGILTTYGGNKLTPITVRYHCTEDITPYLVPSTELDQLFSPTGESFFPSSDDSGDGSLPLPNRCPWDDGYTLPPIPEYDPATYLCTSAVLDVRYELFWRSNQIVQLDAVVILGSVPLSPQNSMTSGEKEVPAFVSPPPTESPTEPPTEPLTTSVEMEVTVNVTEELITPYANLTDLTSVDASHTLASTLQPATLSEMTAGQTTEVATTQGQTTAAVTTDGPTTADSQMTTGGQTTTPAPTTQSVATTDSGVVGTLPMVTTDSPGGSISQEPNTPLPFTQRFTVKFTHLPTILTDPTPVDPPTVPAQDTRSGNPGYITGKTVLSGLAIFDPLLECNSTEECAPVEPAQPGEFVQINDTDANRLRVWVPGPGSLCSQSSLADVTFGEDHFSGCILRLGWSRFSNCSTLREVMLSEFMSMVAADRISRVGDADIRNEENWAQVFKAGEFAIPTELPPTTEAMTTGEMTTAEPTNETMSSPLELLQGLCYDVPTGVNIEILYANAGEYGSVIQHEILAAYVTYTKSTVKLQCTGANGFVCNLEQTSNETTDWVQSFPVTSTVTFTLTEFQRPLRCDYDQCEEELLFPLSLRFQGDSRTYTVGVAVFVIFLTIVYMVVTKPWSFII